MSMHAQKLVMQVDLQEPAHRRSTTRQGPAECRQVSSSLRMMVQEYGSPNLEPRRVHIRFIPGAKHIQALLPVAHLRQTPRRQIATADVSLYQIGVAQHSQGPVVLLSHVQSLKQHSAGCARECLLEAEKCFCEDWRPDNMVCTFVGVATADQKETTKPF
jgi:hypothetical protein